ncbi:MAG TPA: hypothetical protein DEB39_14325 [Planctomycetaceae bacterium]|nr:hypothetical protein [Planctomycetaceae bacterium]
MTTIKHDRLKPWVREEIVPFSPKKSILQAANHYKDAQSAWDAWTVPDELLCALIKTNSSRNDLIRCSCDLASVALRILQAHRIDVRIFHFGIAFAKQCANQPSYYKMLDYVSEILVVMQEAINGIKKPLAARYAARTLFKAVRSVEGRSPILEIPFLAQRAILAATHPEIGGLPLPKQLLPGVDNTRLNEKTIRAWQCKRIRKFFSERPVYREPEKSEGQNETVTTLFGQLLPIKLVR